ncbi:MAG: hypothetical protein AAFZ87_01665 [Planctomycetota bacterium]
MKRAFGYAAVAVWGALAQTLQLLLQGLFPAVDVASPGTVLVRALAPDFATLVLVAAVGRLARRDALHLALFVALGRASFTAAPPLGVAAGALVVAVVADGLRGFAELDRPVLRFLAAAAGAALFSLWIGFVEYVRFQEASAVGVLAAGGLGLGAVDLSVAAGAAGVTAVTTAVIGLVLWRVFAGLPGLVLLERRAF